MPHPLLPVLGALSPQSQMPLPTVQALQRISKELDATPIWAPRDFWRRARLRANMRLQKLHRSDLKLRMPKYQTNDCRNCTDICCMGAQATVLLRLRDLAALIDLDKTHFISHQKPEFSPALLEKRPALARQVGSVAWNIFPVMKQDEMGACIALDKAGLCGLFPHWPLSCARFPISLDADDDALFYSRRCRSYWIHPQAKGPFEMMAASAVAGYNARISDALLIALARKPLEALGLWQHLNTQAIPGWLGGAS